MTQHHPSDPFVAIIFAAASILGNVLSVEADTQIVLHILQCIAAVIAIAVGLKTLFKKNDR